MRAAALERDLVGDARRGRRTGRRAARGSARGAPRASRIRRGPRRGRRWRRRPCAGQRARARAARVGVGAARAARQQALELGERRVARAVLAVDGDDDVAGPARHSRRAPPAHARLAGVPMPPRTPPRRRARAARGRSPSAARCRRSGWAACGPASSYRHRRRRGADGPSSSGTIQVPWSPRTAAARWAASVITRATAGARRSARPTRSSGPMLPGRELALLEVAQRVGDRQPQRTRAAGVPKPSATRGTPVRSTSRSASSATASSAAQRSLSIDGVDARRAGRRATPPGCRRRRRR